MCLGRDCVICDLNRLAKVHGHVSKYKICVLTVGGFFYDFYQIIEHEGSNIS